MNLQFHRRPAGLARLLSQHRKCHDPTVRRGHCERAQEFLLTIWPEWRRVGRPSVPTDIQWNYTTWIGHPKAAFSQ